MEKNTIIKNYNLNKRQINLIDNYIKKLRKINKIHNLVGPSTIDVAWDRHINDSLQLSEFILNQTQASNNETYYFTAPYTGDNRMGFWYDKTNTTLKIYFRTSSNTHYDFGYDIAADFGSSRGGSRISRGVRNISCRHRYP